MGFNVNYLQNIGIAEISETIFEFEKQFRVLFVDGKHTTIGMEVVVANSGVELVVNGIVGTQAVIYSTISYINISETLQCKGVVKQFLRYT